MKPFYFDKSYEFKNNVKPDKKISIKKSIK